MKNYFFITMVLSLCALPLSLMAKPTNFYQEIDVEDQKRFDLLPNSTYLYPQAFADNSDSIKTIKLRVCVEWTEPSQAGFSEFSYASDQNQNYYEFAVPYQLPKYPHTRFYYQFSKPSVCRRFSTVVIPTSETVLNSIKLYTSSGDQENYNSLYKINESLDRRIQNVTTDQTLQTMRREMEVKIKQEILEGPFIKQLKQEIYEEVKAQFEHDKSISRGIK